MGGSSEWDGRVMDSLKNFDLSSPDVKQQFGKFKVEKSHALCQNIYVFLASSMKQLNLFL